MPLYEYSCGACEHTFETLVGSKDPTPACPQCRSREVERLLSVPAAPPAARSLPVSGCDTAGPPCSPVCCRLPQG